MSPIQRDENALDVELNRDNNYELGKAIQEKLWYMISQSKRTRNTQFVVKETAIALLKLYHEQDVMNTPQEVPDKPF